MKRIAITLMALVSMCAPVHLRAQNNIKQQIQSALQTDAVSLKFNADDPIGDAAKSTAGTPWENADVEPIELPEGVHAAIPDPLPGIDELSNIQYNSAVSMAFECMRILYGEMSEEDAKAFTALWAPLYDNPSEESIAYFNKLNPLLCQFIAARESYFRTASDLQLLYLDAAQAVDLDDQDAFESILIQSRFHLTCLKSLEEALLELANKIKILGNPPNPFIAKAEARRKYNRAFTQKKHTSTFLGECWMGTRETNMTAPELGPLTEVMFRYLFKAWVGDQERYYVIELSESGVPNESEMDDEEACIKYLDVKQMDINNSDGKRPDFTSDGRFQTYFPKPPILAITTLTMNYLRLKEGSRGRDEEYFNAVCHYGNRVLRAGPFFKVAIEWSAADKWNKYEYYENGAVPAEALEDFAEAVRAEIRQEIADRKKSAKERRAAAAAAQAEAKANAQAQPVDEAAARRKAAQDSLEFERKSKEEAVQVREELIAQIESQIRRENEYKSRAQERLSKATSEMEVENARREIKDIDMRIMNMQSNIQNERDNIHTLKTGEYVHTRTVCDEYSFNQLIKNANIDAERRAATRRYAEGMERLIKKLPTWYDREEMTRRADELFYENGGLVSGDLEKAKILADICNNKIVAKELKEQAWQETHAANLTLMEDLSNAVVVGCGTAVCGIFGEALAESYGAEAAIVTYGPKIMGAVYGATTGYIAGGVEKGVTSAAGYIHPITAAMASFYEGYTDEKNANMSTEDKIWEGCKKAGFDYALGKAFEFGTGQIIKRFNAVSNKGLTKMSAETKQKIDAFRTHKQNLEALDEVATFKRVNAEYQSLLKGGTATSQQLAAAKASRDQMAGVINASYQAKWHMKYKADPELRTAFSEGVQANYDKMIPSMTSDLEAKGFDMSGIEFKPFRNASSAGTSSMDLDLGAVSKFTGKEPNFYRNGKQVSAGEFMAEAQQSMNSIYRQQTGLSAKASEMNLTTSAHAEAFGTEKLLQKNVDFYSLTRSEVASVGKVIDVKMEAIDKNISMTATTKLQAKAREATKEVENMLLPKLKQDLEHAKDATKATEIAESIDFWKTIQEKLVRMGKQTDNPIEIQQINNEIRDFTKGKDAAQVVNDLAREFDVKW